MDIKKMGLVKQPLFLRLSKGYYNKNGESMWVDGFIIGVLTGSVATVVALHLKSRWDESRVESQKDSLLGTHGLTEFREKATELLADRRGTEMRILAVVDVDQYKDILSNRGEDAADQVVVHLGDLLTRSLRAEDLFARIGRREFALVLEAKSIGNINTVLDRLRTSFSVTPTVLRSGENIEHTLSIGYTIVNRSAPSLEEAMDRATQALDKAKDQERNCIRRVLPDQLDTIGEES